MKFIALCLLLFGMSVVAQEQATRYELLSGRKMGVDDSKDFWDKRYADSSYIYGKAPAASLAQNIDYIPSSSRVLDVGMGEGRNAVFLARRGHKVVGVDISKMAINKARALAAESGVRIETVVSSMGHYEVAPGSFDAIICYYYVDKEIHSKLVRWLRPGGILIYEAYTTRQKKNASHIDLDLSYLLEEGEVLGLFPGLRILKYEEPLHRDDFTTFIIAQKPKR